MDILALLMRWLHIASMTVLVGGAVYATLVLAPASGMMSADERKKLWDRVSDSARGLAIAAVGGALISGTFNLLRKTNLPQGYHMWFGIKFLIALHVLAVAILAFRNGLEPEKRIRMLKGTMYSGLIVLLLSAWLRAMQL